MEMEEILDKLQAATDRYDELNELISDPGVIADPQRFIKLSGEEGGLRETVEKYNQCKKITQTISDDKELLHETNGDGLTALTKEELARTRGEQAQLKRELKVLPILRDPNDDKNIITEIRGAARGDETSLFATDLCSMYLRYAEKQGWKVEVVNRDETEVGGFKEVALMITGDKIYSKLEFESGTHRAQRVPITESAGRVHTSTTTVRAMPEAEDVNVDIGPEDIWVDVYHSSGAGGQHINKTSSAIRMIHLPIGIVVAMQDERSQQQNRAKVMRILEPRVYDYYQQQGQSAYDQKRKDVVGTGDRSERIRTYNCPQNRVTDHRIGLTLNELDRIMVGDLDEIIEALIVADQTQELEQLRNE